jgi:hypothetical protein
VLRCVLLCFVLAVIFIVTSSKEVVLYREPPLKETYSCFFY